MMRGKIGATVLAVLMLLLLPVTSRPAAAQFYLHDIGLVTGSESERVAVTFLLKRDESGNQCRSVAFTLLLQDLSGVAPLAEVPVLLVDPGQRSQTVEYHFHIPGDVILVTVKQAQRDGACDVRYVIRQMSEEGATIAYHGGDFSGRSDYGPFFAVGIPPGGTASGSASTDERAVFTVTRVDRPSHTNIFDLVSSDGIPVGCPEELPLTLTASDPTNTVLPWVIPILLTDAKPFAVVEVPHAALGDTIDYTITLSNDSLAPGDCGLLGNHRTTSASGETRVSFMDFYVYTSTDDQW